MRFRERDIGQPAKSAQALNRIGEYSIVEGFPEDCAFVSRLKQNQNVTLCSDFGASDDGLRNIPRLYPMTEVIIMNPVGITDASAAELGRLRRLRRLDLEYSEITDATLEALSRCRALEVLDLSFTRISDEGLAHLVQCKELKELRLRGTGITSDAILSLRNMQSLRHLDIAYTQLGVGPNGFESNVVREIIHLRRIESIICDAEQIKSCEPIGGDVTKDIMLIQHQGPGLLRARADATEFGGYPIDYLDKERIPEFGYKSHGPEHADGGPPLDDADDPFVKYGSDAD